MNNVKFKLSGDAENLTKEFMLQEKSRQSETWAQTEYVVQGHVFDNRIEDASQSLFDFLMKPQHEIISFKMCDRLCECWLS